MSSESKHIKYTAADIEKYFSGSMSAKEMHVLEKAALDDPFLAEAMEGFESLPAEKWKDSLNALKLNFKEKHNKKAPVVPFWKKGLKLAAGIVIMGISVAVGYWVWNNNQSTDGLANKISTTSEAASVSTDSVALNNTTMPDSAGLIKSAAVDLKSATVTYKAPTTESDIAPAPAVSAYQPDTSMVYRPTMDTRKYKDLTASSQTVTADDIESEKAITQTVNEEKTVEASNTNVGNAINNSNNNQVSNNNIGFSKAEAVVAKKGYKEANNTDEVIVVGYGTKRKETTQPNEVNNQGMPIGGWDAFRKYVANNIQLPAETRKKYSGKGVTLHFQIKKNGKPTKILVQQSLSSECDNEAIRLLENGPRWNYVKNGINTTTVIINF